MVFGELLVEMVAAVMLAMRGRECWPGVSVM